MKKLNRIARIAKIAHYKTPVDTKIGLLVVASIIVPAAVSITMRVIELGSDVQMYF
jgi:hypothetical protein